MSDRGAASRFTVLYKANYEPVVRFVSRRIGPGVEAEDVTAEVFRVAWREVSQGATLSPGWLYVTAQNMLRNHRRATQRMERLQEAVAGELRSPVTQSGAEPVHDALDELREVDREILVLRYWDELAAGEIAAVLGVSVSAVWVRLHRARRAFRNSYVNISGGERAVH